MSPTNFMLESTNQQQIETESEEEGKQMKTDLPRLGERDQESHIHNSATLEEHFNVLKTNLKEPREDAFC